ncbi:hypothetical protein [Mycobacterium tuberculosis]|uniref:hypothetical protein n=1 Tax=Mycobacterium tuberculosis TaxID=1773 RepID=UPI0032B5BACC
MWWPSDQRQGHGQAPAALLGGDGLIPAELVAELAKTAGLQPIPVPGGTEPIGLSEAGGVRLVIDLSGAPVATARPQCDLDHTIAFADGVGPPHAANLKCLCRLHHLPSYLLAGAARQLPDGTVIWTLPGNQTNHTPGQRAAIPALCTPP